MLIFLDSPEDCLFDISYFTSLIDELGLYIDFNNDAEVSIVLTDDNEIMEINSNFRGINCPTDVLSFPMEVDGMLGDIVISLDTAISQANERGESLHIEVAFLFIHGFLHLLGYDHETNKEDEKEMFDLQDAILISWAKKYARE